MKLSSSLLARWLQSTGLQNARDSIQAYDPDVDPTFYPVIQIPGPLSGALAVTVGAPVMHALIARESWGSGATVLQAANVAFDTNTQNFQRFGRGTWDIAIMLSGVADYAQSPFAAANCPGQLQLFKFDPVSGVAQFNIPLLTVNAGPVAAAPPVISSTRLRTTFPDDGWQLVLQVGQTIAAQTLSLRIGFVASRLI